MKMRYCKKCRIYTLGDICKKCGGPAANPVPARFSPTDQYGKYRRKLKLESA